MTTPRDPLEGVDPLCRKTAAELTAGYAKGEFTPVDVARAVLARAEQVQPELHAFTRIDREGGLEAARASERRWRENQPLSPVDGVPATVKDIVWMKDQAMRYGTVSVPAVEVWARPEVAQFWVDRLPF